MTGMHSPCWNDTVENLETEEAGPMRLWLVLASLMLAARIGASQGAAEESWRLESTGAAAQARARLQQAAQASGASAAAVRAYAEFLDRYRDPAAHEVYARLAQILNRGNAPAAEQAA